MEYAAFCITIVAVIYTMVLVQPGMIFGPLYQKVQDWTFKKYGEFPEDIYWMKPLVSCVLCVSGQWCFWGYLVLYSDQYNLGAHLYFTAFGIFTAAILKKIYLWTK